MEYTVRLREIIVHEIFVESESAKGAFFTAIKKAHRKKLNNSTVIGRFIELDHVIKGRQDVATKPNYNNEYSKPEKLK